MKLPVTVVIPTYNRAKLIGRAIDSVLRQTVQPQEIIVVDDGSTDDTARALAAYGSRVQVVRQKHRGVSAARNRGAQEARGQWLAFLDSDDEWHKTKLEKQWKFAQEDPQVEIVQTDEVWVRYGKRVNPMKKHQKKGGNIFKDCLPLCSVTPSSVLMSRALFNRVGGFDEKLPVCEDYDLWLRIARDTPIYLLDQKLLTRYVEAEGQLSKKYWGMDRFRVYALEKLLRTAIAKDQRDLVEKELIKKISILAQGAWKRKKIISWLRYRLKCHKISSGGH